MRKEIRVLILGEDPIFQAGIYAILARNNTMRVVGSKLLADCPADELRRLGADLDVVIMTSCPSNSMDKIFELSNGKPVEKADYPRFLVVSTRDDHDAVVGALRAGASGYLVDIKSPEDLLRSIHIIAEGGAVFCPLIASRLSMYFSAVHDLPGRIAFPDLTDREREVLDLIASGFDNRQIARKLSLAEKTIRNHITHIFLKLQVSDRTTAAMRARDVGLGGRVGTGN